MRIGVLTCGGGGAGLHAGGRAVRREGGGEDGVELAGREFVACRRGWGGPLDRAGGPLGVPEVRGILPRGGTILGASRTNPFKEEDGPRRLAENLAAEGGEGLIAIGGD